MYPAARIGDPISHDQVVPCGVIGPPLAGQLPTGPVLIEMMPAAHATCTVVCSGVISGGIAHPPPPPGPLPTLPVTGSPTVFINGMPALRWAPAPDVGPCGVFLGDAKMAAARTVVIGDVGFGGATTVQGQAMQKAKQAGVPFVEKCTPG